jgi:hypothetical protein
MVKITLTIIRNLLWIDFYQPYQAHPMNRNQLLSKSWLKTGQSMQKALKQYGEGC